MSLVFRVKSNTKKITFSGCKVSDYFNWLLNLNLTELTVQFSIFSYLALWNGKLHTFVVHVFSVQLIVNGTESFASNP